MREITAREHVPFLPLNEILHQQPDQNSLVFDFDPGHLSYRGHQEVGKMICEFLAREQVVRR